MYRLTWHKLGHGTQTQEVWWQKAQQQNTNLATTFNGPKISEIGTDS